MAQRRTRRYADEPMIYQPPDYDDELSPAMREQRDRFRQLFDLVLDRFRGHTRKALVIALIDAMTEATIAGELCEPACEELTIEIQLRYQDAKHRDEANGRQ